MIYSSEENLIIQSTCNAVLLAAVSCAGNTFIDSDYFKQLDFGFPKVKDLYTNKIVGVGNQGMMLVCMYALLVLPKERILSKCETEYRKVNLWINEHKESETDTYPKGKYTEELKHIYHLRNAISHGNVEFDDTSSKNVICIFKDKDRKGHEYCLKMTVENVGELVMELIKAQQNYVDDIVKKNSKL